MSNYAPVVILIAVVAWSAYRRIRRIAAYQAFSLGRLRRRIVIFAVLGALPLAAGYLHPFLYVTYALGAAAGGAFSIIAARSLVFEQREDGLYYRTRPWVEIVVLVLFFGRIGYRAVEISLHTPAGGASGRQPFGTLNDPLSAAALAFFVAYYISFARLLLVRSRKVRDPRVPKE